MNDLKIFSPTPLAPSDYAGIRRALSEDGVAVITDILKAQEQETFLDYFWDAITIRKRALQREEPSTWMEDNTDWYGTFGAGQYKHYGMAQEKHCWLIRRSEVIRRVFEEGVFCSSEGKPEPCCVSLDGCAALFRPAVSGLATHVDLVPGLVGSDWGSVQGAYNLYAVEADVAAGKANAGFVCVVGSHRQYESMWAARKHDKSFKWPTKHWHKLEEDSPLQRQASLVTSPANSLVLWRSDLLHRNYGGDYSAEELGGEAGPPRLARLTQFITFSPKKFRSQTVLQRKASAVLDGCCNNHWAALALRVPITPFPAWSAASKKIRIVRPFANHRDTHQEDDKSRSDDAGAEGKAMDQEEDGGGEQKRKRGTVTPAPGNKKSIRKVKKTDLDRLPLYVQDLL